MNEQEQERLFEAMVDLRNMLSNIELDVRKAGGYSLEYDIQQLENLIYSVGDRLANYFEHGIEEKEAYSEK